MKYGADGYALYWLCLEYIVDPISKDNISFELEHDSEILAHRLHIDTKRVEEIMRYFIHLNLFEIDNTTQAVTCIRIAKRLDNSIVKNPELKEIQENIQENMRKNPGLSRIIPENPGQIRLEEIRGSNIPQKNEEMEGFDEFWGNYPRKVGKKDAKKSWKKLSEDERFKAINDCNERYSLTEIKFIPYPASYLNKQYFNDDDATNGEFDDGI